MVRVRQVNNQQDFEKQLDEYNTLGYKEIKRHEDYLLLKKEDWGKAITHIILFALLGWWTLGIPNVVYAAFKNYTAERILIEIPDGIEKNHISLDSSSGKLSEDSDGISDNLSHKYIFRNVLLHIFSGVIFMFIILSILYLQISIISQQYTILLIVTIAGAVAFRYILLYHRFSNSIYKGLALTPTIILFISALVVSFNTIFSHFSINELLRLFENDTLRLGPPLTLPKSWFLILHILATILALVGTNPMNKIRPYPKPMSLRSISISPVYFGLSCTFFGLWAVLFVGIAIQRVILIAPIFEELLKFGVAILIGSTLFDRSLSARIGVALMVGSTFGLIEHSTTYPTEADVSYLFRTIFHAMSTILSVSIYTIFEVRGESKLQWIAVAYPIIIHFFYNSFVVLSSIVGLTIFGTHFHVIQLFYGLLAIILMFGLLLLAGIYQTGLITIHRPIEQALSEFV